MIFFDMSDWDTAPITLRKRVPKASTLKSEKVNSFVCNVLTPDSTQHDAYIRNDCVTVCFYLQAVNDARRQGYQVETQAKCK